MRNEFVTPFWKNALASLPEAGPARATQLQLQAAERWELGFGALIELVSRAWNGIGRQFQAPTAALHLIQACLAVRANPTPPPPPLARVARAASISHQGAALRVFRR